MTADSPFRLEKPKHEEEKSLWERFKEFFAEKGEIAFSRLVPSDDIKDMPPKYKYGFGITLIVGLFAIFCSLFITSYISGLQTQYLSPLSGTTASDDCETISVANTGTYLATQDGYWQGTDGFQYAEASYQVTATSYTLSESDYVNVMSLLYDDLVFIGNFTKHLDLGYNLIYWSSFTALPDNSNTAQRFSLVGDPLVIFNRQYVVGSVSSIHGVCNITSVANFDEGRGYVTLNYPIGSYQANDRCQKAVDPAYLGYLEGVNSKIFSIYFDVRTLMTGIAMNLGIINFAQIVEITADRSYFVYNGQIYNTSSYYDPQFPGMTPLTCIKGFQTPLCALTLGTVLGFPFFLQKGNSTNLPERCKCSKMSAFEKQYAYSECNKFQILAGFLFYQSDTPDLLFELAGKYHYNLTIINELLYNASFVSSFWGETSLQYEYLHTEEYFNQSYEFCKIGNITCSLATFSLFDFNYNWAISNYYFQLQTGACQDTISTSWENWNKLIVTPFAPLVQEYEKCYPKSTDVFVTQFGVSWANLAVITPFFVISFILCIYFYQRCTGHIIPTAYSKKERDEVLEALAISLLLARDRQKMKDYHYILDANGLPRSDSAVSISEHSTLNNLVKDLQNDADYHLNTYKLDDKIKEFRVNWGEIGRTLYSSTVSPLASSLHGNHSNSISHTNNINTTVQSTLRDAAANQGNQLSFRQTETGDVELSDSRKNSTASI